MSLAVLGWTWALGALAGCLAAPLLGVVASTRAGYLGRVLLFGAYVGAVVLVLGVGVQLLLTFRAAGMVLFLAGLGALLAWPHRHYLAAVTLRRA